MKRQSEAALRGFGQIVSLALIILGACTGSASADQLHIWIKAFLPNAHPSRPGYVQKLPGQPDRWAIPGPTAPWTNINIPVVFDTCYLTDNRSFSNDPTASARITSEAIVNYQNGQASVGPYPGRPLNRADPSHEVDCSTGGEKNTKTADVSDMHFGSPAVADGMVELTVTAQAKNPLAPSFGTPAIDYGGTFLWNVAAHTLRFKGSTGVFPAFEAYASLNGGPPISLFQFAPKDGTSVWNLYDLGIGLNTRDFIVDVDFPTTGAAAGTAKLNPILTRDELDKQLFISNGMQVSRASDPAEIITLAAANSAADAGDSQAQIETVVSHVRAAITSQAAADAPFGLDLGRTAEDKIRAAAHAALQAGTLAGLPLEGELRQDEVQWTPSPQSGSPNDPLRLGVADDPLTAISQFEQRTLGHSVDLFLNSGGTTFKAIYGSDFQSLFQVAPGQVEAQLKQAVAANRQASSVGEFLGLIQDKRDADGDVILGDAAFAAAKQLFGKSLSKLNPVERAALTRLASGDYSSEDAADVALSALQDATGFDARKAAAAAQALADGSIMGDAEAGVYLASTLVGLVDPRTAKEIDRVGRAAIAISNAIDAYNNADETNLPLDGGADIATGNYVGAALAIYSLVSDSSGQQQSADQVILDALNAIHSQIEDVRMQMNARFDRVDEKLDDLYKSMSAQFAAVEQQLSGIKTDVEAVRQEIGNLDAHLTYVDMHLSQALDRLDRQMTALSLAPCLRWRESGVNTPMPAGTFITCMSQLSDLAELPDRDQAAVDPATIKNTLVAGNTNDIPAYLILASPLLGYPFLNPLELQSFTRPSDWTAAAGNYLRVAQAWPQLFRDTSIKQLQDILDRGHRIQKAIAAAKDVNIGEKLLVALLQKYDSDVEKLDATSTAEYQALDLKSTLTKAGEQWQSAVRPCEEDAFEIEDKHYPDIEPDRNLVGTPATAPPDMRVAQRLSVGSFSWCLLADNVHAPGGVTKPYEVALMGQLTLPGGSKLNVGTRFLRAASASTQPLLHVVGGIACCYWAPDLGPYLAAQWQAVMDQTTAADIQPDTTGWELPGHVKGVVIPLYNIADGTADFQKRLAAAVSDRSYRLLLDSDNTTAIVDSIEVDSRLISAYAQLSVPDAVAGNDGLHELVNGNHALFGRDEVLALMSRGDLASTIKATAERRSAAVRQLLARAFQASASIPSHTTDLDLTVSMLNAFYQQQLQLCAAGQKPANACIH